MNYILIIGIAAVLLVGIFTFSTSSRADITKSKSAYEKIAALVCPDSKEAMSRAKLIASDLSAYFKKYEDEIFETAGIEDESELSAWHALVLAFENQKFVVIADWKDQGSNFGWLLGELALSKKHSLDWSKIEALGDDYKPTAEYADLAEAVTTPKGLSLIWFDIDSDSYPIALVSSSRVPELQKVAKKLSKRILVFDKNAGDV